MTNRNGKILDRAREAKKRITEVLPSEAREQIVEGALLLDVRDQEKFESGHIDEAMNISNDQLEMRIGEVAPDKQTPIVCYCAGGNRGALAADALQQMGYTRVVSIQGGLRAYNADVFPTGGEPK
jgi:rhodanese-related sulfurtransferase